jgi:excisionase family DNA binding protein
MYFHENVRDAIKANNLKALAALLKKGIDLKHDFKRGWTALHLASRAGHVGIVKVLLDYGAEVNATTNLWKTPLDEAIHARQDAAADLLREQGGKRGLEVSLQGAIAAGNLAWVKKHLAAGADLNALTLGELPLGLALARRQWDVAQYLLRKKADVTRTQVEGDTALHVALESGAPESLLKAIVRSGADVNAPNKHGESPLSIAARAEDESAVRFLLAHGANPKTGGVDEVSPVSAALDNDNHDLARLLIDQGAKATLHQAARCGHLPTVQKLVRAGADLEATNDSWDAQTPLLIAVHNSHPEIVEFLLESKADPNVQESFRAGADTPLHLAVKQSSAKMLKLLLAAGADPDSQNSERLTPLEQAKQRGNSHLVHLMEAHLDRDRRDKAVEQLFTIHKVAELLSVDELFVLNLIKAGKLRELRLNPETVRIPESALGRYLSSLEA